MPTVVKDTVADFPAPVYKRALYSPNIYTTVGEQSKGQICYY